MSFATVYRVSFYVMLFFATLVVSIDAADQNPVAPAYPIAVAIGGALALITVDRNPKLGLDRNTANLLAVSCVALSYLEYRFDENLLLLAGAHWLVYLQLIKMFLPKEIEDDWFLFAIALIQVIVGGVMSQSDAVGAALFGWALSSLWVLGLFTLHREAIRARIPKGTSRYPRFDTREPYPRFLDYRFVMASVRVAALTLCLGGVIFLAMPRRGAMGTSLSGDLSSKHLTGFDDDVQLGQLGEILENDSVVMTVTLTDSVTGKSIRGTDDILWRGVTLTRYSRGHWRRQGAKPGAFPMRKPNFVKPARTMLQQYKLEPSDNPILFALKPVFKATAATGIRGPLAQIDFDAYDGSFSRGSTSNVAYDYTVESGIDLDEPQPWLDAPDQSMHRQWSMIDNQDLATRLRAIAAPIVADIPPDDIPRIARKLESWLRDSNQFHYSLEMDVVDPSLDPVVDFLLNKKVGHCEYFASALALMLRSLGIPCRLVNGFKGGDWNDLSSAWVVRQKHAHSWVEVLTTPAFPAARYATWIPLDPTPGGEREASIAKIGGFGASFRQLSDFGRFIWTFYVVGFNADRQQRFLYEPVRQLFLQARYGYELIWEWLKSTFAWMFHFPTFSALVSVRGLLVLAGGVLLLFGLIRLGLFIGRRVWRRIRGERDDLAALSAGTLFYRRLVDLLKEHGMERPPNETPRDFARRATYFLLDLGAGVEYQSDIPPQVVEAYYRVRFGRHELNDTELSRLEARLDALEASLKTSK